MVLLEVISIHGGQAMAETLILLWSATYFLCRLGGGAIGCVAIAPHSQLLGVKLDPLGSIGLESGQGKACKSLP